MLLNCTREPKSWSTCPRLLIVTYFWIQRGSLLFDRNKKLTWVSPVPLGRHLLNFWILSVPGASSVSLASLRITSDFWNNVVIDQQNLFAALQESSVVLMIIWLDFPWRNTSILIVPPIPLMGPLPWWATLQCQSMPIDQQIGTVGGNKLKDEARPELCCTSITPKNNFCQRYIFPHFFDDEINTRQHCSPGGEQTESWLFKIGTLNIILLFVFIWFAISTWRTVSPSFILVLHELYVANYVCFLLMCSLSSITICNQ